MAFNIIYITHPDENSAKSVSNHLLENKLIACANIFPISSAFWWKEAIQHETEWVTIVKTTTGMAKKVEKAVKKIHPYEVPCIMKIEVSANKSYEKWIRKSVSR